jgi:hypothetical protein
MMPPTLSTSGHLDHQLDSRGAKQGTNSGTVGLLPVLDDGDLARFPVDGRVRIFPSS